MVSVGPLKPYSYKGWKVLIEKRGGYPTVAKATKSGKKEIVAKFDRFVKTAEIKKSIQVEILKTEYGTSDSPVIMNSFKNELGKVELMSFYSNMEGKVIYWVQTVASKKGRPKLGFHGGQDTQECKQEKTAKSRFGYMKNYIIGVNR